MSSPATAWESPAASASADVRDSPAAGSPAGRHRTTSSFGRASTDASRPANRTRRSLARQPHLLGLALDVDVELATRSVSQNAVPFNGTPPVSAADGAHSTHPTPQTRSATGSATQQDGREGRRRQELARLQGDRQGSKVGLETLEDAESFEDSDDLPGYSALARAAASPPASAARSKARGEGESVPFLSRGDEDEEEQDELDLEAQRYDPCRSDPTHEHGAGPAPVLDFEHTTAKERVWMWSACFLVACLTIVAVAISIDWIDWPGDGIGEA
ncbi:hypothetical protein IE81DRAFT_149814 [Ceraceosorus guamensis]|uniref:Uncharacterized protein n=1 Tax=Ceraceosorus guamensis TaxID=1522189 RepID=A0A316W2U5_9BASI|nr:hypothetical protein IE81DRAFT_149814 [Ceraceosorus guamensis]PWN41975.1 hypothetical protein IE81DRAFT_149814 [Ceraceosorus guamensis]